MALLTLILRVLAVMMTFAMTTSLLHVVDWTRESMCLLGVALYHRRLPFAPRPSPRGSEDTSRPCMVLQICLRTIWRCFNALLSLEEIALALLKHSPPIEVASPSDAHRLRPLSSSLHGPSPSIYASVPSRPFAFRERLQRSHWSQLPFVRTRLNDLLLATRLTTMEDTVLGVPFSYVWNFTGTRCC